MSNRILSGLAICGALMLSGCGSDAPASADSERPASVIGDPLHRALERAESVQGTLDDRAAELRQRLEESEGN